MAGSDTFPYLVFYQLCKWLLDRKYLHFLRIGSSKDYDINVLYHSGKANVVVDELRRVSVDSLVHVESEKELVKDV